MQRIFEQQFLKTVCSIWLKFAQFAFLPAAYFNFKQSNIIMKQLVH